MEGERELTTGLLSKDASFRLIVSGDIGVREIERLIRKLEIDKEILADYGEAESEAMGKVLDTARAKLNVAGLALASRGQSSHG